MTVFLLGHTVQTAGLIPPIHHKLGQLTKSLRGIVNIAKNACKIYGVFVAGAVTKRKEFSLVLTFQTKKINIDPSSRSRLSAGRRMVNSSGF